MIGPLPGVIGAMMAGEAVKDLTGAGTGLRGRLLLWDGLYAEARVIATRPRRRLPGLRRLGRRPGVSPPDPQGIFRPKKPEDPVAALASGGGAHKLGAQPTRSLPMKTLALAAAFAAATTTAALAESHGGVPDLGGREVVVVTENAYPPLQFIDPKTGEADRLGVRLHGRYRPAAERQPSSYENISWDAMIPAVSEGQYDLGMTGITITRRPPRAGRFLRPLHALGDVHAGARRRGPLHAMPRPSPPFDDGLIGAQAGTTPFYVAVYDVLDGDEANPRIHLFETFGAAVQALAAGDVDLVLTDGTAGEGLCRRLGRRPEAGRRAARHRGFRLHLPEGLRPRRARSSRDRGDEGRRHDRGAEHQVVPRLQARRLGHCRHRPRAAGRTPRTGDISLVAARRRRHRRGSSLWQIATRRPLRAGLRHRRQGRRHHRLRHAGGLHAGDRRRPRCWRPPPSRAFVLLRQVARFYVEVIRGVPMLVLLFYIAFVAAPGLVWRNNCRRPARGWG